MQLRTSLICEKMSVNACKTNLKVRFGITSNYLTDSKNNVELRYYKTLIFSVRVFKVGTYF